MTTSVNPATKTNPLAMVRDIVGVEKEMGWYMAEEFGNYFYSEGSKYSYRQTRVFIPCPENGVREVTDIIGHTVVVLPDGRVEKNSYGAVKKADLPSDTIVAQFQCYDFGEGVRRGWVICPIEYVSGYACDAEGVQYWGR